MSGNLHTALNQACATMGVSTTQNEQRPSEIGRGFQTFAIKHHKPSKLTQHFVTRLDQGAINA